MARKSDAGPAVDTGSDSAGPDAMADAGQGTPDVATSDLGAGDTGAIDRGPADTGPADTGPADTGPRDTGPGDAGPLTATWTTTAQPLRAQSGAYFTFSCPASGAPANIWGTDAYTDDSSICTAAVHAGLATLTGGGVFTIQIIPGLAAYTGSVRNGITSLSFTSFTGSFRFPAATTWTTNAVLYRGLNTQLLRYVCPAQGSTAQSIYGTNIYTDDSPVCVAAVHAGLITAAAGGQVQIQIVPGQSSYAAATQNGVTSLAYGAWTGSYLFPP